MSGGDSAAVHNAVEDTPAVEEVGECSSSPALPSKRKNTRPRNLRTPRRVRKRPAPEEDPVDDDGLTASEREKGREEARKGGFRWATENASPWPQKEGWTIHPAGFYFEEDHGQQNRDAPQCKKHFQALHTVELWVSDRRDGVDKPAVATILATIQAPDGLPMIAVHYFWRWNEIYTAEDTDPAETARERQELFLQKNLCASGEYKVKDPDGNFTELLVPVGCIVRRVTAIHAADIQRQGRTIEQYLVENPSHYWYRYEYDHTLMVFSAAASGRDPPPAPRRCAQRRMADMFCGIGTVALAARSAGWQVKGCVEIDYETCVAAKMNLRLADEVVNSSVQDWVAAMQKNPNAHPKAGDFDYIHFSPPCQNYSNLNKNRTATDDEGNISAVLDVVRLLQPPFITVEEVTDFCVTTTSNRRTSPCVPLLRSLLDLGYQLQPTVLNAVHYGVPQLRPRFFLFGARIGYELPSPPKPRYFWDLEDRRKRGAHFKGGDENLQLGSWGNIYLYKDIEQNDLPGAVVIRNAIGDLPGTLQEQRKGVGDKFMRYNPADGSIPAPQGSSHPSAFAKYMREVHCEGAQLHAWDPPFLKLHHKNAEGGDTKRSANAGAVTRLKSDEPSRTVTQGNNSSTVDGKRHYGKWLHPTAKPDRMLTVLERMRLQSMPDWVHVTAEASLTQANKRIGNAVPYLMGWEITASVLEAATGEAARRPPDLSGWSPCNLAHIADPQSSPLPSEPFMPPMGVSVPAGARIGLVVQTQYSAHHAGKEDSTADYDDPEHLPSPTARRAVRGGKRGRAGRGGRAVPANPRARPTAPRPCRTPRRRAAMAHALDPVMWDGEPQRAAGDLPPASPCLLDLLDPAVPAHEPLLDEVRHASSERTHSDLEPDQRPDVSSQEHVVAGWEPAGFLEPLAQEVASSPGSRARNTMQAALPFQPGNDQPGISHSRAKRPPAPHSVDPQQGGRKRARPHMAPGAPSYTPAGAARGPSTEGQPWPSPAAKATPAAGVGARAGRKGDSIAPRLARSQLPATPTGAALLLAELADVGASRPAIPCSTAPPAMPSVPKAGPLRWPGVPLITGAPVADVRTPQEPSIAYGSMQRQRFELPMDAGDLGQAPPLHNPMTAQDPGNRTRTNATAGQCNRPPQTTTVEPPGDNPRSTEQRHSAAPSGTTPPGDNPRSTEQWHSLAPSGSAAEWPGQGQARDGPGMVMLPPALQLLPSPSSSTVPVSLAIPLQGHTPEPAHMATMAAMVAQAITQSWSMMGGATPPAVNINFNFYAGAPAPPASGAPPPPPS